MKLSRTFPTTSRAPAKLPLTRKRHPLVLASRQVSFNTLFLNTINIQKTKAISLSTVENVQIDMATMSLQEIPPKATRKHPYKRPFPDMKSPWLTQRLPVKPVRRCDIVSRVPPRAVAKPATAPPPKPAPLPAADAQQPPDKMDVPPTPQPSPSTSRAHFPMECRANDFLGKYAEMDTPPPEVQGE